MKKTINVLASDFENNYFHNLCKGEEGCPIERAITRENVTWCQVSNQGDFFLAHQRVLGMFKGKEEIRDFSFEVTI